MIKKYPRVNDYRKASDEQAWDTFPGVPLDGDFTKLHNKLTEVNGIVSSVARFGPAIKSGIVTIESVGTDVLTGFLRPVYWMPDTYYPASSVVIANNGYHYTPNAITSLSSFVGDTRWITLIGQGNGSPVTQNNFVDLQDPAKARGYLGIRTMALQDAGIELTQFRTNTQNDGRFLRRSLNLADLVNPEQFLLNIGLSEFAVTNNVVDMTGPRGLFGRVTGAGDVLPITAGSGLTLSGTTLTHTPVDVDNDSADHDGVLTPNPFKVVLNRAAFGFVGDEVVAGMTFGAMRLDRYARVRHAPAFTVVQPTITPGAWRTRPMSECSSLRTGATLDGNRVFLPAGIYMIEFNASSYAATGPVSSRTRFRRVSAIIGGVETFGEGPEIIGTCAYDANNGLSIQDEAMGLVISEYDGYYELQQQVSASVIAGQPVSLDTARVGARELYSEVRIFRLDASSDANYGSFTFTDNVYKVGSTAIVHVDNPIGRHNVYKVGAIVLLEPTT